MTIEEMKQLTREYNRIKYSQSEESIKRRQEIEEKLNKVKLSVSYDERGFINIILY